MTQTYTYFPSCGNTVIRSERGQHSFLGTSVEDLTRHMQDAANAIERNKRHLAMLHSVVQDMQPDAVTYMSTNTAQCDVSALR